MKILITLLFGFLLSFAVQADEKSKFQERMNKDLARLDVELDKLKLKSREAVGTARTELDEQIKNAEAQRKEVTVKMKQMAEATGDAWKDIKNGAESAYSEMKKALTRASSHFKK
ncbi:MAG: hypothetical protein AB7F59_09020 [Bdellovibrionales bacterium]